MGSKKLKKLSEDEVWKRWNERMTRVRDELHHVFSTRKKFRDVTSLFETNSELKAIGGDVWDWLFRMWARDIVISIRRELDNDVNTVCLGRLLDEMAQRPKVITRRRFLRDIPHSDFMFQILSRTFDAHGVIKAQGTDAMEDSLDPTGISQDRKHLLKVLARRLFLERSHFRKTMFSTASRLRGPYRCRRPVHPGVRKSRNYSPRF